MLAVGLLPFVVFGLLALAPMLDTSDDTDDFPETEEPVTEEPVTEEPVTEEPTAEEPVTEDPVTEEPVTEEPTTEEPTTEEPAPASSSTTVQITAADGTVTEVVIDATDPDAPTSVDGSDGAELIVTPSEVASSFGINGLGAADTINFGFGVDVDGGEGADVLTLTVTEQALANGDLVTGEVNFADTSDALVIDVAEEAVGFIHEVRIDSSENPDENTTTNSSTLLYILSPEETLTIDAEASAALGEPVLTEGSEVLIQIDLGSQTTVTGTDAEGAPTSEVTGGINNDPNIMLNRDVTSSQTLTF